MSDNEKLDWLMRLIVTAGGPEQKTDEPDALFRLRLTNWMLRVPWCEDGIRTSTEPELVTDKPTRCDTLGT